MSLSLEPCQPRLCVRKTRSPPRSVQNTTGWTGTQHQQDILMHTGSLRYYTRQEQEDALATQITNPNRVGSGFIDLGPQQRFAQGPAANWQTSSLLGVAGAAPQQVAEIWNASANTPPLARSPRLGVAASAPAPASVSVIPQSFTTAGGPQPLLVPQNQAPHNDPLFNAFAVDAVAASRIPAAANQVHATTPFQQPHSTSAFLSPAVINSHGVSQTPRAAARRQPPLACGQSPATSPPPPPPPPGTSLMNMLNSQGPAVHVIDDQSYTSVKNMPLPQPGGTHTFAAQHQQYANVHVPPSACCSRKQARQVPTAALAPAKTLQSAADYAAAAQQYRPPVPPAAPRGGAHNASAASVSRKAETTSSNDIQRFGAATQGVSTGGSVAVAERSQEWECLRCTFLNNGSLWECEMCCFERPGKPEPQVAIAANRTATHDAVWQTSRQRRPNTAQSNASAKSKAQTKNEKRRAKKRADGLDD